MDLCSSLVCHSLCSTRSPVLFKKKKKKTTLDRLHFVLFREKKYIYIYIYDQSGSPGHQQRVHLKLIKKKNLDAACKAQGRGVLACKANVSYYV